MAASRTCRALSVSALTTAAMTAVTLAAAAAGMRELTTARHPQPDPSTTATIVAVTRPDRHGTVTLTLTGGGAHTPGWVGLDTTDGQYLASPPLPGDATDARRHAIAVEPSTAACPLRPGAQVTVNADPWLGANAPFGHRSDTVTFTGPQGPLSATVTGPADARRAVVYVHGRGGNRATGWWLAPTCAQRGWQLIAPTYRNDIDGPAGDGRYLLGGEWVDLATVMRELPARGIDQVVLVGWSMGGNIVASYLKARDRDPARFAGHPHVAGMVYDAPALDWGQVLRHVASSRSLPAALVPLMMTYGQLAAKIDWRDLNHLDDLAHLDLPTLLFHGTEDTVVPASLSVELAARLDTVELHLTDGAAHCRSVNLDPGGYLDRLAAFLDRL